MQEVEEKRIERLRQINSAAECSLEIGLAFVIVMVVIFLVLIQDDPNIVLFIILSVGIFTVTISSYDSVGFIRRASGLLLPWYMWIIKSFCYFISGGSISGQLIVEYVVSFLFMLLPAMIYEYSAPSTIRSGIGLRIIFLCVAIIDLLPFEDSNPFLSIEKGISRSFILSLLFILYSIRARSDTSPQIPQDEYTLSTFIKIQYSVFGGFWLAAIASVIHALYLAASIMMSSGKKIPPKRRIQPETYDSGEEYVEETPQKPATNRENQLESFGSEKMR